MRPILFGTILLSIAVAYYVYIPLPSNVSEPWKLLFTDAVIRSILDVVRVIIGLHCYSYVQQLLSNMFYKRIHKSPSCSRCKQAHFCWIKRNTIDNMTYILMDYIRKCIDLYGIYNGLCGSLPRSDVLLIWSGWREPINILLEWGLKHTTWQNMWV